MVGFEANGVGFSATRGSLTVAGLSTVPVLELRSRRDAFSYQVSATNDPRFWFRLERERTQDVITDFFIGAVPEANAAEALIACYRHLALIPRNILIFRDILPSSESEVDPSTYSQALQEAQDLSSECGRVTLLHYGATNTTCRLEKRRGKYDLIISGTRRPVLPVEARGV